MRQRQATSVWQHGAKALLHTRSVGTPLVQACFLNPISTLMRGGLIRFALSVSSMTGVSQSPCGLPKHVCQSTGTSPACSTLRFKASLVQGDTQSELSKFTCRHMLVLSRRNSTSGQIRLAEGGGWRACKYACTWWCLFSGHPPKWWFSFCAPRTLKKRRRT